MTYYEKKVEEIRRKNQSKWHQIQLAVRSKRFIDQHFREELGLDQLAASFFVSKYHFIRLFKRYHGLTPHQYLMDRRIAHAKELLKAGHSVTDACQSVGFQSLSSFNALFKRKTGRRPSAFHNKVLPAQTVDIAHENP